MAEYQNLGLRWGTLQPHRDDQQSDWYPVARERERDVLAVCQKLFPGECTHDGAGTVHGRDLSQSVKRRVGCTTKILSDKTEITIIPTVMPQWRFWIEDPVHRFSIGKESMAFQGFPVSLYQAAIDDTKDETLASLGGNAMSAGVLFSVFISVLMVAPWQETSASVCASEADMMHALNSLFSVLKKKAP